MDSQVKPIPPPYDSVVDTMETLFKLLIDEENGAVRAVLGHYFFVYIHPYTQVPVVTG